MVTVRRSAVAIFFICLVATSSAFGSATNVYITQSGSATGNCTTNVQTPAFFNNAANWGSGASQIGPSTTVLICGTFTGAAGATEFKFQGNGSSGSPVTLKFDTGARLNAPYWSANGAITCSNQSYITVDGGTNGLIQNTANGTSLANQAASAGLTFSSCSNATVQNLTIKAMYFHTGTGEDGGGTVGISFNGGDSVVVQNNTITDARTAIDFAFYTVTSLTISGNTTNDHVWGIHIGDSNGSASASGVNVNNNTVGPSFNVWDDAAQDFHADGIFFQCANSGARFTNSSIYNNYVHGDMSSVEMNGHIQNSTGYIYVDGACRNASGINVYNNVVSHDVSSPSHAGPEGLMVLRWSSGSGSPGVNVYNNTLNVATPPYTDCVKLGSGSAPEITFKNNVLQGCGNAWTIPGAYSTIIASDRNVFYNIANHFAAVGNGPTYYSTLATWTSATSFDPSSSGADPSLTESFTLNSGSSAIGRSVNLHGLGIASLDNDKTNYARLGLGNTCSPAPGTPNCWDAGAFQYGDGTGGQPTPPTGLAALVH
jgi:hypothetical protein